MTYDTTGACVCNTGFTRVHYDSYLLTYMLTVQALTTCIASSAVNSLTSRYPLSSAIQVTYNDILTGSSTTSATVSSATFNSYFLWAAYYCEVLQSYHKCAQCYDRRGRCGRRVRHSVISVCCRIIYARRRRVHCISPWPRREQ